MVTGSTIIVACPTCRGTAEVRDTGRLYPCSDCDGWGTVRAYQCALCFGPCFDNADNTMQPRAVRSAYGIVGEDCLAQDRVRRLGPAMLGPARDPSEFSAACGRYAIADMSLVDEPESSMRPKRYQVDYPVMLTLMFALVSGRDQRLEPVAGRPWTIRARPAGGYVLRGKLQ